MKQFSLFAAVALIVSAFLLPSTARAQGVSDFTVTTFKANFTLTNEDPQGLLTITEQIELDFRGQNQGVLRAIPNSYKGNDVNLKVISVERDGNIEPYITYLENDNTIIRIGEAGNFITGEHSYVLNYQVENVVSFLDKYDEFFWDVNGNQWLQSFQVVSVQLETGAARYDELLPRCFTGIFGSTESNCEIFEQTNGLTGNTLNELKPFETLSVVQAYDKGYFTPPSWVEKNRPYLIAGIVALLQGIAVASAHKSWRRYGDDPKKRGIVAPYFERPKGVSVMQASYVSENKLFPAHVSAGIIDLSIRGYLKIVERKIGKKVVHELVLTNIDLKDLASDELLLLSELFKPYNAGTTIQLEAQKNKLYTVMQKLRDVIDKKTAEKGYYGLSPKNAPKKFVKPFALAVAGLLLGFIMASPTSGISIMSAVVVTGVVAVYYALMTKRTVAGNMLVEHMEGLKLYLDKAEKDRMKMQDTVAAPLSSQSGQPIRDVAFFEELLPFAVAMNVEKSWAAAFKDIYEQPPEWYKGNWQTFNAVALASSISNTTKVTNQTFSPPSSSGSSGFSGGSAGGGGGGGGGGGW